MATITKAWSLIPQKPKYMRWNKWYLSKQYKDSLVTSKKLNKVINRYNLLKNEANQWEVERRKIVQYIGGER
jgi:hypothetical protein